MAKMRRCKRRKNRVFSSALCKARRKKKKERKKEKSNIKFEGEASGHDIRIVEVDKVREERKKAKEIFFLLF